MIGDDADNDAWLVRVRTREALRHIEIMPDIWCKNATVTRDEVTRGKHDRYDHSSYAQGIAAGLDIAGKHLAELLPALVAALPTCKHGVAANILCDKGCL
jgi:hypothetical protein